MKGKLFTLIAAFILLLVTGVKAQGPSDPGDNPDGVPIDGGLSVLVASGVAYGVKKLRDKSKNK